MVACERGCAFICEAEADGAAECDLADQERSRAFWRGHPSFAQQWDAPWADDETGDPTARVTPWAHALEDPADRLL